MGEKKIIEMGIGSCRVVYHFKGFFGESTIRIDPDAIGWIERIGLDVPIFPRLSR